MKLLTTSKQTYIHCAGPNWSAQRGKNARPVTLNRKEKDMAGSLKGGEPTTKKKSKKKAAPKKAAKKPAAKKR